MPNLMRARFGGRSSPRSHCLRCLEPPKLRLWWDDPLFRVPTDEIELHGGMRILVSAAPRRPKDQLAVIKLTSGRDAEQPTKDWDAMDLAERTDFMRKALFHLRGGRAQGPPDTSPLTFHDTLTSRNASRLLT